MGAVDADVFSFNWSIQNFSYCFQTHGEALQSPYFTNGRMSNATWNVLIYPRGCNAVEKDSHVSCFLNLVECENEVTIGYSFQVLGITYSKQEVLEVKFGPSKMEITTCKGCPTFISRQTLFENADLYLPNNTLTIQCQIWEVKNIALAQNLIQKRLNLKYQTGPTTTESELLDDEEAGSLVSELEKDRKHEPIACFVCSRLNVYDANFEFFGKLECSQFASVLIKSPPLLLQIKLADSENKKILIRIRRVDDIFPDIRLFGHFNETVASCNVFLVGSFKEILQKEKFEYIFHKLSKNVWKIDLDTTLTKFDINGNVHLKFEYRASNGAVEDNFVRWDYKPIPHSLFPQIVNEPINAAKMSEFYDEQKFCDLKLVCADSKEFHAHKMVLCMGSAVFKAMFDHDTEENRESTIKIDDLSSGTVNLLLKYFYSGQYPELEWSDALHLFAAADKYQVSKLVYHCSILLRNQFSVSNVCDILLEADRCNDTELKTAAINFACHNLYEVFCSEEWKTFFITHSELASELMKYVAETFGTK